MRKRQLLKKTTLLEADGHYFSLATVWNRGRLLGMHASTGYTGFNGSGTCALFSGYKYEKINDHKAFYRIQARIAAANPHYTT